MTKEWQVQYTWIWIISHAIKNTRTKYLQQNEGCYIKIEETVSDQGCTWLCIFPHAETKCLGPARYPSRQPVIAKACMVPLSKCQTINLNLPFQICSSKDWRSKSFGWNRYKINIDLQQNSTLENPLTVSVLSHMHGNDAKLVWVAGA